MDHPLTDVRPHSLLQKPMYALHQRIRFDNYSSQKGLPMLNWNLAFEENSPQKEH